MNRMKVKTMKYFKEKKTNSWNIQGKNYRNKINIDNFLDEI